MIKPKIWSKKENIQFLLRCFLVIQRLVVWYDFINDNRFDFNCIFWMSFQWWLHEIIPSVITLTNNIKIFHAYLYVENPEEFLLIKYTSKLTLQNEDTGIIESKFRCKAKKKNCYVALSRPTVKCKKTGSFFFFFFFFMSDLAEEFAKICIQWLKKALAWLVYVFWLHSARVFPHLETEKKNIGKLNSLTVRKKKKIPTDRPNF